MSMVCAALSAACLMPSLALSVALWTCGVCMCVWMWVCAFVRVCVCVCVDVRVKRGGLEELVPYYHEMSEVAPLR